MLAHLAMNRAQNHSNTKKKKIKMRYLKKKKKKTKLFLSANKETCALIASKSLLNCLLILSNSIFSFPKSLVLIFEFVKFGDSCLNKAFRILQPL